MKVLGAIPATWSGFASRSLRGRVWGTAVIVALWIGAPRAGAQQLAERVRDMEAAGNTAGALALIEQTAETSADIETLTVFAEFFDRHGDARARAYYARLLDRIDPGDAARKAELARRLVLLDLLANDRDSATKHLDAYRAAGGRDFAGPIPSAPAGQAGGQSIEIPGPLASFARMAAFTPELEPDDILPALGRNVITSGYRVTASYEGLQPTEYMKLLVRYLSQARELDTLAGDDKFIRITQCDSSETAELLRVLGYRMRGACGSEVILETVNASRAFLTIDSGFPLAELEQALRTNRAFSYDYRPARLPLLYSEEYWLTEKDRKRYPAFIDAYLADPSLCRLYLAMSKMDRSAAEALRKRSSLEVLKAFAHVLDFFGGLFELRDGKAVVPGGERAKAAWTELVGATPDNGAEFFEKLVMKDDGWLASYYDALRRIDGPALEYLTESKRLERFYLAIRGKVTSPGPARPVFRSNADLMLLTTRLRIEPDGRAHLPGSVAVWAGLFAKSPHKIYDEKLRQRARSWKEADDVIEALFALCRKPVDNEPLKIFMALSDINRIRSTPLQEATVNRLAQSWLQYGDQYPTFAETGRLRDETILAYLDAAERLDKTGDRMLRADAAGSMQALVGLWQIGVRHLILPEEKADEILAGILGHFGQIGNRREVFENVLQATQLLLASIGSSGGAHDRLLALVSGATETADAETHHSVVAEARRIFDAQRLAPLDDILDVERYLGELAAAADNTQASTAAARSAQIKTEIVNRLASRVEDLGSFREGLSSVEKNAVSFGYWSERHLDQQRKMNLRASVQKALGSPDKLRGLRADLLPLLRDTLVGYNYVHYAPPGAQLLRTNPLFVRGHDFIGTAGANQTWSETEVYGTGWPSSAGGRLVGSLAGLPYALAQAEQNFLIPGTEQALIWTDLVPQMLLSAKVPRWWNVSPQLMHWVALHLRVARSAVAAAVLDPEMRRFVVESLAVQANPSRVTEVAHLLDAGDLQGALDHFTPSELFLLGSALAGKAGWEDPLAREIRRLANEYPARVNAEAVSRAFGSPKPKLASSYRPELLHIRTFPTLMGYSSRIMAESWESNLIFFATLADELYLRPSQLNLQVPEWTRRTVETIFATHLEDWPAVLRSLREVGEAARADATRTTGSVERAALQ